MDYTRYSRAVVVLEERSREFAARPREEIKGYLRVETGNSRGAFRCVIQNVKYFPRKEYTYQLILFGKRKERTIHTVLGTIPINRYGTGEVYLRFRPENVDGEGNDYSRYTTAIIAAVSSENSREQLHPVLMGMTGYEEKMRISAMTAAPESTIAAPESTIAATESTSAAPEATPASQGISPAQESLSEAAATLNANSATTPQSATATPNEAPATAPQSAPAAPNEAIAATPQSAPDAPNEAIAAAPQSVPAAPNEAPATTPESASGAPESISATYNHFYGQYLKNVCNYLCSVSGYYHKIQPFSPSAEDEPWRQGVEWLKIDNPRSMFLVSPGAQYFSGKYGHFLLGCGKGRDGKRTYYVAVPGRFHIEEQPDGGESGFQVWLPIEKGKEAENNSKAQADNGGYGYWILAIDGENGDIFSPQREKTMAKNRGKAIVSQ